MQKQSVATVEKTVSGEPIYYQDLIKSPWSINTDDYSRIDSKEIVERTVNVIKNDHVLLVLASVDGHRYGNTILIRFDEETLSIDRPLDFDDKSVAEFRVYFQDILNVWCFFDTKVISDCPYSLCATYPEHIYRLQRRKYNRVSTPSGTRAIFWQNDHMHDAGIVKDISAAGMLICTCNSESPFQDESSISEIAIALPKHPSSEKVYDDGKILLPVIRKGTIVRSFKDIETDWICHGISFEENLEVQEVLSDFVSQREHENELSK